MAIVSYIPFTIAALYALILEWLINNPGTIESAKWIYWAAAGFIVLFNLPTAWLTAGRGIAKDWYNFILLPATATLSTLGLLTITASSEQGFTTQLLIIGLTMLIYFYWRAVFFYFHNPSRYTSFSLENMSFYANFVSVFLAGAAVLGIKLFLGFSLWLALAAIALWLLPVVYQIFWVSKYPKTKWYFALALWLGLVETFAALVSLPHDHRMLGFVWATIYYLGVTVINDHLRGYFDGFKVKAYLTVTLVSWVLLFVTAIWL